MDHPVSARLKWSPPSKRCTTIQTKSSAKRCGIYLPSTAASGKSTSCNYSFLKKNVDCSASTSSPARRQAVGATHESPLPIGWIWRNALYTRLQLLVEGLPRLRHLRGNHRQTVRLVRVVGEILLMVVFRRIEGVNRLQFGDDGLLPTVGSFRDLLLGNRLLLR